MKKLIILLVSAITMIASATQQIHPDCQHRDVDNDGLVSLDDVQAILDYLERNLTLSCDQLLHADINRDWQIDLQDASQLIHELDNPHVLPDYGWGDINGDRIANEHDLTMLSDYINGNLPFIPTLGIDTGDISGDGIIDELDLDIFSACANGFLTSPFNLLR